VHGVLIKTVRVKPKNTFVDTEPVCRASASITAFPPAGLVPVSPRGLAVTTVASEPESASIELPGASFERVESATCKT